MAVNDDHCEGLVRIEQKAANDSERNIQGGNETERALCGQLMLVSTVFLTISVVVLGDSDSVNSLDFVGRVSIIITFVLILASIACGIKYYFDLIKWYERWGIHNHEMYEAFRDHNLGFLVVDINKINKKTASIPTTNNARWLKLQISMLLLAAVGCIATIFAFLFSS